MTSLPQTVFFMIKYQNILWIYRVRLMFWPTFLKTSLRLEKPAKTYAAPCKYLLNLVYLTVKFHSCLYAITPDTFRPVWEH